jgi:thioredoxin-like negative regulator of GroEL
MGGRKSGILLGLSALALAACEPGAIGKDTDFQRNYDRARTALEQGNYELAARNYAALIPAAGPHAPRMRLEYAHALLRAGRHDEAAAVAGALARDQKGSNRAAALAVAGTALHESALADMRAGRPAPDKLRRADAALAEMLQIDPSLDPLGAMQSRRDEIAGSLRRG